jgi:hypothetical protein
MSWQVPGDPEQRTYASREEALARAWELTPAGEERPEPSDLDLEVTSKKLIHSLTWKHIMAPGEGYSQRLKRMAMEEMGSAADGEGYVMLASTLRYTVNGNEITFYCDARPVDMEKEAWDEHKRGMIAMRYGMISDE